MDFPKGDIQSLDVIGCLCRLFVILAVRKPTGLTQHSCVPLWSCATHQTTSSLFLSNTVLGRLTSLCSAVLCAGLASLEGLLHTVWVVRLQPPAPFSAVHSLSFHLRTPSLPHVSRVPPPPPPTPPPKSSVSLFARRFCVFISLIVFLVVLGNLHTFLLEVRSAGNVCLFRVGSCCHFGSSDSSVWREKIPRANPVTWFEPEYYNDLGIPCFAGSGAQFRVFWLPLFFISAIHGGSAGTMTAPRDISFTLLQSPRLPRLARCPFCQFRAFFAAWDRPTLLICLNSV